MVKLSRFKELGAHSLRLSDVTIVMKKAMGFSRMLEKDPHYGKPLKIIKGGLGDPTLFGFKSPRRLKKKLQEAVNEEAPYTDSIGFPPLLEELSYGGLHVEKGKVVSSYKLEHGKDAFIFVGPGSSGVVRAYKQIVGGGKKTKVIDFVPELTYPMFVAESSNVEADMVTVAINPETGVLDVNDLEKKMTKAIRKYGTQEQTRYMLNMTTIGNPLGSAMSVEIFDDITQLLKDIYQKSGVRIHRLIDPTYEPFRRDQSKRFDSVERIMKKDSSAIELVTGTFSKSACWLGERVGFAVLIANGSDGKFDRRKAFEHVDIYHAITLGTVSIYSQMAIAKWLNEIRTSPEAFEEEQERQLSMRKEVNGRVEHFAKTIASMDEAWLHSFFYPDGTGNGFDTEKLNSFYVLWRFRFDRQEISQAALFAEWTLYRALEEIKGYGEQRTPVVLMNDGDMFFARTFRNNVPQYIRTVALVDNHTSSIILNLIKEFGGMSNGTPPKHPEPSYPF